jgi:hypothetical protein
MKSNMAPREDQLFCRHSALPLPEGGRGDRFNNSFRVTCGERAEIDTHGRDIVSLSLLQNLEKILRPLSTIRLCRRRD